MIETAYKGKVKKCYKGCDVDTYFESRYDDSLKQIVTKDGKLPNGKFGKDNNVKWWLMEDLTKQEHLNCTYYNNTVRMEKTVGAKTNCQNCGAKIECKESTYQGKTSLSWYDEGTNNKHYSYDFKTKVTTCKTGKTTEGDSSPATKEFKAQRININDLKLDGEYVQQVIIDIGTHVKTSLLEIDCIIDELEKVKQTPYPAYVGMIWNQYCENKRKRKELEVRN